MVAIVGVPLFILICLEFTLRCAGYGYSTDFFKTGRVRGVEAWVENSDFGRRFFPPGLARSPAPLSFPQKKPANTIRIFVMGESAAMGDPDLKFGLPRMLAVLLRERYPDRRFEVINTAMVAINCHVILPIARACANREGDLWVVYMGNNEMVGPFGSTSVFGTKAPPMCLVRAGLWLRTTRTGQLLDATTRYFQRADGPREWTGMELMAGQAIRPGSKATQRVYQNFETNLREILTVASRAHVPVILCTVASNLRDCPPFASLHREGLSSEQLNGWRGLYEEGVSAQMAGDAGNALNLFMKAAGIDDEFADLAFRRAECSLEAGRLKDAAAGFQDARDKDALQFRADTEINKMIRNAATAYGDRGVRLLDAESFLVSHSANGVPGADFFYEHVHFTPEGNYELSRAVADEAARALSLPTVGDWLSGSNCFRALGLTDWNRFDALNTILDRIQSAPFTAQLNHTNQVEKIRQSMANLKFATKPAVVKQQALEVSRLADKNPDDPDLRWNLAILMQNAGDYAGAEQQWRALQELQPQSPLPGHNLAQLLEGLGRTSEAPNR